MLSDQKVMEIILITSFCGKVRTLYHLHNINYLDENWTILSSILFPKGSDIEHCVKYIYIKTP